MAIISLMLQKWSMINKSNAMILTCTNKGETTTECSVIMGKEFILFVYDDVALKYHIQNARQIK